MISLMVKSSSAPENLPSDIDAQEIATTAIRNSGLDIGLVKDMGTVNNAGESEQIKVFVDAASQA